MHDPYPSRRLCRRWAYDGEAVGLGVNMSAGSSSIHPAGGKWWLVTWTTYGTWLPGDPRGFRTWRGSEYVPPPKRYAAPDEATYRARDYSARYEAAQRVTDDAVLLSSTQCQVACDACVTDIDELGIVASVIAVGPVHTHLLARFGSHRIRPTVGRLKSMMTRAIKEHDPRFQPKRTWSKGCHPRSCVDECDYRTKFRYVERHRNDGAIVHVWPGVILLPDQFG